MAESRMIDKRQAGDLAASLALLHDVWTRPDFQAAARQHARGKLTVREKIDCLFRFRNVRGR